LSFLFSNAPAELFSVYERRTVLDLKERDCLEKITQNGRNRSRKTRKTAVPTRDLSGGGDKLVQFSSWSPPNHCDIARWSAGPEQEAVVLERVGGRRMGIVESFEGESGDGCKGAKLAALCVGVSAYSEQSKLSWLGNAGRDAEAMFKKMKDCPNCRAAIMRDPKDKKTILHHLRRDFLDQLAALPEEEMPEAVMVIVAGHGKQDGQDVFLIPSDAKSDTREALETECLSHLTVLEEFNKFADRTKFFALPSVVSWTTHKHTGVCVSLAFSLSPPQCLPPALIKDLS
jgi:hypothetical protein